MRLTLAAILLMASAPAWAGDLLIGDGPIPAGTPAAAAPLGPAAGGPPPPYAGLYDAPLFGHVTPTIDRVDETALRYYAAQKNRTRVEAEIKRLHTLHPAWKVPANLYATGTANDEQPLWDLFAAARTEELRVAIQAREKREAGWRPSADLLAKMARQETATGIKTLSDAKDWTRLLALAAARPDALGCGSIDLAWRVAEAFAATGAATRAYEVDAAILRTCKDRDERLATVNKAVDLLPGSDVDRLIAAGDVLPDGAGEFDEVRLLLARREIGQAIAPRAAGGEAAPREVPAATLEALGTATLRSGDASDAALLAWYAFGRERWAEADDWFKLGLASSGDAKLAEGHALALKALGRLDEAEQLAHAWRERSPLMRGLFVTLMTTRLAGADATAVAPAAMADFTAILTADRSVPAAGALGWIAYGRGDFDDAAQWFGRAVDWAGRGEVPDGIVEGFGLALKSLGRFDTAEDFLFPRRDHSATVRNLYVAVAVAALSGGAAPDAVGPDLPVAIVSPDRMDRFGEVIQTARAAPGAAALGWRNLRDGRPAAAVDWFRQAADWSPDGKADIKTVEGLVLALKSSGQLPEAEDAAFARADGSAKLRETYLDVVAAELTTPSLAARLTPDRVARFAALTETESSSEGAEALGWYRLTGNDCGYGTEWFRRAVAWSPDHRGTAKGNEGYAQALARAGHDLEADDIAVAWADRSPDIKALAISLMAEALTRDLFARHVSEERLGRLSTLVREEHSVAGAQALGWYRYREPGVGYGIAWFEDAIRWSPDRHADAKTVEGYASALRDVGRLAEAEEALFPFADAVPLMRDLYIDTVVSELTLDDPPEPMPHDRLARFIAVATPLRSAAAAQALGWYRFARREYPDAAIWFKYAVDWWPAPPPDADRYTYAMSRYGTSSERPAMKPEDYRRTPRAFASRVHDVGSSSHRYVDTLGGLATTWGGYALALRATGREAEAEDIAFAWRERWPMLGRLFIDLAIEALTKPGAPAIDPERLKRYATVIEESRDAGGAAALGWAAMGRHDPAEAAVWFEAATAWRPADAALDARVMAGYIDALRATGRLDDAFAAASGWAEQVPELKAKLVDVALDMVSAAGRPSEAKGPKSMPERLAQAVALAQADTGARGPAALGWYYLGLRQPALALPSFKLAVTRAADAAQAASPTATREGEDAAMAKAVEGLALTLRALGRDGDVLTFVEAWSARLPELTSLPGDTVADLLGGAGSGTTLAPETLERLAALTLRGRSVPAAEAFGWYTYRRREWAKAAGWFADGIAWSPDHRGPMTLVEGYAASLHNQCRFDEAEAAALSRPDGDERLRAIYVDSVADRVARTRTGVPLSPADAASLAAATMAIASPNGAQALGWYGYRSHQFPAAAAWFEKAVAWRVTEAEVYGLALSYRRVGDAADLSRVLSLYEGRFASLAAVRRAGIGGREPPIPQFGDLGRRGCAGTEPADPSVAAGRRDPLSPMPFTAMPFTAMSFTAMAGAASGAPGARIVAAPVVSADRAPQTQQRPLEREAERHDDSAPHRLARRPARAGRGAEAAPAAANDHADAAAGDEGTPSVTNRTRCHAVLRRAPVRSAADRQSAGWCLLALQRPAEAAEAFRAARGRSSDQAAGENAFGEALSHIRQGDTGAAVESAALTSLPGDKRRELGLQLLSQQAYDAFAAGRWTEALDLLRRRAGYAPESRDLRMLRGWAHYNRGDYDDARRSFAAADAQLSDHDSRHALATVDVASTPKAFR